MKPTRDQARAAHAYEVVGSLREGDIKNFKIVVNSFGATVLKGGLCAAVAWAQRYPDKQAGERLLAALGEAGLAGVGQVKARDLPGRIRGLDPESYMLATRDAVAAIVWFRRAVQAAGSE